MGNSFVDVSKSLVVVGSVPGDKMRQVLDDMQSQGFSRVTIKLVQFKDLLLTREELALRNGVSFEGVSDDDLEVFADLHVASFGDIGAIVLTDQDWDVWARAGGDYVFVDEALQETTDAIRYVVRDGMVEIIDQYAGR